MKKAFFCATSGGNPLKHDTIAVYMFQEVLIKYLKNKFTQVSKNYYFCDGAPQQFKNKKLLQIFVIVMILMFMKNGIFFAILLTARDRVMD